MSTSTRTNPPSLQNSRVMTDPNWQMSLGERSALTGLVADLKPAVSIEIGTAEGASLAAIAEHSGIVHSFDLVEPLASAQALGNVTFHTGDNHMLLPAFLARLAEEGTEVDFALVDGDHTTEGVRQDVEDLLASDAIRHCVILMHDTMNEVVREGIATVDWSKYPKARYLDLDYVPGSMSKAPEYYRALWGGIGILRVDTDAADVGPIEIEDRSYEHQSLVRAARELVIASDDLAGDDLVQYAVRVNQAQGDVDALLASPSWRVTRPLRAAKNALKRK